MLSGAQVSEQADNDHVVVVCNQCTLLGLFHAEDEHREKDVLGTYVVRALQSLLADVQSQVNQSLLQLLLGKRRQFVRKRLIVAEAGAGILRSVVFRQLGRHKVESGLKERADVLVFERCSGLGEVGKAANDEVYDALVLLLRLQIVGVAVESIRLPVLEIAVRLRDNEARK